MINRKFAFAINILVVNIILMEVPYKLISFIYSIYKVPSFCLFRLRFILVLIYSKRRDFGIFEFALIPVILYYYNLLLLSPKQKNLIKKIAYKIV